MVFSLGSTVLCFIYFDRYFSEKIAFSIPIIFMPVNDWVVDFDYSLAAAVRGLYTLDFLLSLIKATKLACAIGCYVPLNLYNCNNKLAFGKTCSGRVTIFGSITNAERKNIAFLTFKLKKTSLAALCLLTSVFPMKNYLNLLKN